ncbi:NAD(P)/FAD-dependent oxidoreductase [Paenibacillus aquistagni]|uniref:NAD(P)/FAD-dependent oxidoreductase n=1 Tax=Paenibacillus aquistagni TaxID=1852522 RepID=UPI000B51351B|nr:NAD(P)/FAD-dependent oxidoreductase [Paenibacillus aquistagni]
MHYECIIIGGGIAGLQAAIQLGRYKHRVLLIDAQHGRSTICQAYHNVLGWPDGVSGPKLRELGLKHAVSLGIQYLNDLVTEVSSSDPVFQVATKEHGIHTADTLLFATGVMDRLPAIPHVVPCLGRTIYVCPDCDGYEVSNRRTMVLGAGNVGAQMAVTLSYWTDDLIYINHEMEAVHEELQAQLNALAIEMIAVPIKELLVETEGECEGVRLDCGRIVHAERGFVAFGGNEVRTALAESLGVKLMENRHIAVDPRTKMTNIARVFAAGDVNVHSEQLTIAMGEGAQAAIWIHKTLMSEADPSRTKQK